MFAVIARVPPIKHSTRGARAVVVQEIRRENGAGKVAIGSPARLSGLSQRA